MSLETYHAGRSLADAPFRSACYAPFVGLSFDAHGSVSVCAFTRSTPLGRVGEQPLAELWRGHVAQGLRDAVRADDLSVACGRCAEEIVGGNLHGVLAAGFDPFAPHADEAWPARMEFALTNACNLECVMCSGDLSSAIRARREGLPPLPSRYGGAFVEELTPFLAHLRQARFLGGEPFLADINYRIWDRMIEIGSPAECNVTTNGTVWTRRMESVLERLPFSIGVSIDGVRRETVETIRRGASYERIMANFSRFLDHRERTGMSLSLTFCLMVLNWREFAEYLQFAEAHSCQVYVNTVRQPPVHSLYRLPINDLQAVVAALEGARDDVAGKLVLNRAAWLEQLDRLRGHLDERRSAPGRDDTWCDALVDRLAAPDGDEGPIVEALRCVAVDDRVSMLRVGIDDDLVAGEDYVGIDVTGLAGRPVQQVLAAVSAELGHQVDIVAERVVHGAVARVVSFGRPGARPSYVITVTRRGPAPYGTTRYAALLELGDRTVRIRPRRAPDRRGTERGSSTQVVGRPGR